MLQLIQLQPLVLEPVDLEVRAGECVSVRGPSGSGKTLLLRAIADLDPCPGSVVLDGNERLDVSGPEWRRRAVYLAAESGWWAERVADHFTRWPELAASARALRLPDGCGDWSVERLSTGERQRLAMLRALELDPQVLLLDEPTSALDSGTTMAVEELVRDRRRDGMHVLWVTHDAAQVRRVADRTIQLVNGRAQAA